MAMMDVALISGARTIAVLSPGYLDPKREHCAAEWQATIADDPDRAARAGVRSKGPTALGPDHPDVDTSLNNLAVLYYGMGRLEDAAQYARQGAGILSKALGADHPNAKNATKVRDIIDAALAEGKE